MGKRRSQMRQNAPFQRVATPPELHAVPPIDGDGEAAGSAAPSSRAAVPNRAYAGGNALYGAREQAQDQIEWLEDNPLALILGGIALGVLAGLLLPVSDAETERLGDVGENIAEQVQVHVTAIGQDVVEHGKAVVVESVQATLLGGKSPVDAVQQSVQEHLATVAQNAQERVEASLGHTSES
ncbi:MAG: hypothetical protein M3R53_03515 [Candidatus Eremiobacteraeota bacterium]|nr:hypothetical protein [Candidatus Eremiobacteraeota bacterium]